MLSPRLSTPGRSRLAPSPHKKTPLISPMKPSQRPAGSKVRVVARVRPFLQWELDKNPCISIDKTSEEQTLEIKDLKNNQSESYKLDCCYGELDDITELFKAEVEPILPLLFCGCNATVFAYGETGSGKTYTMQGHQENPGLMPLALKNILALAETNGKCIVEISFYELYMERCYDLLEPKLGELPVLEDNQGRIQLRGLAQVQVKNLKEFQNLFEKGCGQRKVGQTGLNSASSRSHSVLVVTVKNTDEANSNFELVGKLNLIDLAGNEDNRKTGIDGVRLVGSSRINQSLFVLSNVINALNANERRVPYRDSKLTRILQDSLGGTSRALMIACLAPGSYSEAAQTLSLAARSRQIANNFGESNETSNEKVDMECKLKAWQGKPPVKSPLRVPSPLPTRLFSKSPSRFGPGQQRHSTKRILAANPSPCSPRNCIANYDTRIYSIVEDLAVLTASSRDASSDGERESSRAEENCSPGDIDRGLEVDKENRQEQSVWPPCTPVGKGSEESNSPPLSSRLRTLGTSLREALSPLPCNVRKLDYTPANTENYNNDLGQRFNSCVEGTDTSNKETKASGWTAVERFSVNSRDLRSALLKEYLDILNTGTREDVLTLKGIGKKRADSIMKLRENSEAPFHQLRDLQKLGVSAKQAEKLFNGNVVRQLLNTSF